jgi:hypothetical protein
VLLTIIKRKERFDLTMQLFLLKNKANNSMYVLAEDKKSAQTSGLIRNFARNKINMNVLNMTQAYCEGINLETASAGVVDVSQFPSQEEIRQCVIDMGGKLKN